MPARASTSNTAVGHDARDNRSRAWSSSARDGTTDRWILAPNGSLMALSITKGKIHTHNCRVGINAKHPDTQCGCTLSFHLPAHQEPRRAAWLGEGLARLSSVSSAAH